MPKVLENGTFQIYIYAFIYTPTTTTRTTYRIAMCIGTDTIARVSLRCPKLNCWLETACREKLAIYSRRTLNFWLRNGPD